MSANGAGKPGAAPASRAGAAPVDEEAHHRLDEHDRQFHDMAEQMGPEAIAGMVKGAHAAFQDGFERKVMDQLLTALRSDMETDRKVIAGLDKLCTAIGELVATLKASMGA